MVTLIAVALFAQGNASKPIDKRTDRLYKGAKVNVAQARVNDYFWQVAKKEIYARSDQLKEVLLKIDARAVNEFILPHGDLTQKCVSITIDDGPHPDYTLKILALLRKLKVKATFFVVGHMVEKYPELAKAIVEGGHELANHTYSHVNLTKVPRDVQIVEYRAANDVIFKSTGKRPRYARPPGGRFNINTIEAAAANGLKTVLWTVDPGDYANPGVGILKAKLFRTLKPGAIILLHDGSTQMLDLLPDAVAEMRMRGYKIVPLWQLPRPK